MPPRLRKRAKVTYTEEDDVKPEAVKAESSKAVKAEASKGKKTKAGGTVARRGDRHIRGKRGGLESMPNMPLDVLIEIFGYLHPRDLLNLARTTRAFRDFLMSRDAMSFWKASRKQIVGLPEPPPDISEPAYANFLFFNHCHGCLKGGSLMFLSRLLARYCKSCKNDWLCHNPYKATGNIMSEFRTLVPTERVILNAVGLKDGRYYQYWYSKAEVDELAEQWAALQGSKPEARRALVEERLASVGQRRKVAEALDQWHDSTKKDALAEKESLKDDRLDAVLAKLRDEGWGDEIDRMSDHAISLLASLDGVNRPTKLTERSWKGIQDAVLEFMGKIRADRLSVEYSRMIQVRLPYLKSVVFEYLHSQWILNRKNEPATYASVPDIALFPEVRAVLVDPSEDVTQESIIDKLTKIVPVVAAKWMEARKTQYRTLARAALSGSEAANAPEPLDLALVAFKCSRCSSYTTIDGSGRLHFPQVLHDNCLRESSGRPITDAYERVVAAPGTGYHSLPRAERLFIYSETVGVDKRFVLRREVITACGMNPDTATIAEMDACEARLRCRLCATLARQEIHTWRTAIQHGNEIHDKSWTNEADYLQGFWERVPEEYAAQARALEVTLVKNNRENKQYTSARLRCSWCWHRQTSERDMKLHMVQRHNITEPQLDVDWFWEILPFPVSMYSPLFGERAKCAEKDLVEAGAAFFATF